MEIQRGQIYFADLGTNNVGSEQSGTRPVLVIQNNIGNRFSPTVIVACVTSRIIKAQIPTHVRLDGTKYQMETDSLVLAEQIKTIDKSRLSRHIATLDIYDMQRVNTALRVSINVLC